MSEKRFRNLQVAMLRRGVALRHARRAVLELQCHHDELIEQALARGSPPEQARRCADAALGSDALIVERYAQQRELQSRIYRWRAGFLLAPVFGFAIVFAAVFSIMVGLLHLGEPELHQLRISPAMSHDLGIWLQVVLLWMTPVALAMAFGALAGRQHIAFRWLCAGVLVLALVAAQTNVRFVLTGGSPAGLVGAGIGFSTGDLPHELARMLLFAVLALVPAAWLRQRALSPRTTA
jgi:hypothetical protein